MTLHDISAPKALSWRAARALTAVLALGLLTAACASAARSTALVAPVTSATLVGEDSVIYRSVTVGDVTGGEETTVISKSKVSNFAFESALETSLDVIGALSDSSGAPVVVHAEIQSIEQPNLQINFTTKARVKYRVLAAGSETLLFEQTVSNSFKAKVTQSLVREERIRLSLEGAVRENIGRFLRGFVADSKLGPSKYRRAAEGA